MEFDQIIGGSIQKILKPLVRILLRHNIPFGSFVDHLKYSYIQVAKEEYTEPLKKVSNAKIATITGISRHDVKKILENGAPPDLNESISKHHRAARVISSWLSEKNYCDENGNPKEIPFEGSEVSLKTLIKKCCGDLPARPIMDELSRIGCVKMNDNGVVTLIKSTYISQTDNSESLYILGTDVRDLIQTIDHNLKVSGREDFLQLKTWSDTLTQEGKVNLRKISKTKGLKFLQEIDRWIGTAALDDDELEESNEEVYRAGISIFYFEEKIEELR